jgi:small subunit ribosomal protein S2
MIQEQKDLKNKDLIEKMFTAGAHFGFARSRRHPTVAPYIFGVKNRVEIFDLEKTSDLLVAAKEFIKTVAKTGKQVVFVGGKSEARDAVKNGALLINQPYVAGRWIGGTFTNFGEIRKRVEKFENLSQQREKGELTKYTKKERLLIDREIDNLDRFFSGIVSMKELPGAIVIVDPKREKNALREALQKKIPVIALAGSDCDLEEVQYPIVGNDSSVSSVTFFVNEIVSAFRDGKIQK